MSSLCGFSNADDEFFEPFDVFDEMGSEYPSVGQDFQMGEVTGVEDMNLGHSEPQGITSMPHVAYQNQPHAQSQISPSTFSAYPTSTQMAPFYQPSTAQHQRLPAPIPQLPISLFVHRIRSGTTVNFTRTGTDQTGAHWMAAQATNERTWFPISAFSQPIDLKMQCNQAAFFPSGAPNKRTPQERWEVNLAIGDRAWKLFDMKTVVTRQPSSARSPVNSWIVNSTVKVQWDHERAYLKKGSLYLDSLMPQKKAGPEPIVSVAVTVDIGQLLTTDPIDTATSPTVRTSSASPMSTIAPTATPSTNAAPSEDGTSEGKLLEQYWRVVELLPPRERNPHVLGSSRHPVSIQAAHLLQHLNKSTLDRIMRHHIGDPVAVDPNPELSPITRGTPAWHLGHTLGRLLKVCEVHEDFPADAVEIKLMYHFCLVHYQKLTLMRTPIFSQEDGNNGTPPDAAQRESGSHGGSSHEGPSPGSFGGSGGAGGSSGGSWYQFDSSPPHKRPRQHGEGEMTQIVTATTFVPIPEKMKTEIETIQMTTEEKPTGCLDLPLRQPQSQERPVLREEKSKQQRKRTRETRRAILRVSRVARGDILPSTSVGPSVIDMHLKPSSLCSMATAIRQARRLPSSQLCTSTQNRRRFYCDQRKSRDVNENSCPCTTEWRRSSKTDDRRRGAAASACQLASKMSVVKAPLAKECEKARVSFAVYGLRRAVVSRSKKLQVQKTSILCPAGALLSRSPYKPPSLCSAATATRQAKRLSSSQERMCMSAQRVSSPRNPKLSKINIRSPPMNIITSFKIS